MGSRTLKQSDCTRARPFLLWVLVVRKRHTARVNSCRILRVHPTSAYPPKLTVNVDGADRQPSALGRQRAVAPSHGSGEHRNEGEDYRFREENAPDIADSVRSRREGEIGRYRLSPTNELYRWHD